MQLFAIRKDEIFDIVKLITYDEDGFLGIKIEDYNLSFTNLVEDFSLTTYISQHIASVENYSCSFRNGFVLMSFLENTVCTVVNFTVSKKKGKLKICGGGETSDSVVFNLYKNEFKKLDIQSPEIKFQDFSNNYQLEFIQKLESLFFLGNDVTFEESTITSNDSKKDSIVTYSIPWFFKTRTILQIAPIINLLSRIPNNDSTKVSIGINGLIAFKITTGDKVISYYQAPLIPV